VNDKQEEIRKRLAALAVSYTKSLPGRLQEIESTWATAQKNNWQQDLLEQLHRNMHSLAGSGATFGYTRLGQCARELEHILDGWLESNSSPSEQKIEAFDGLLQSLTACVDEVADAPNAILRNIPESHT